VALTSSTSTYAKRDVYNAGGAGTYVLGDGLQWPYDVAVSSLMVSFGAALSGNVKVRVWDGTTVSDVLNLSAVAQDGVSAAGLLALIPAGSILTLYLDSFDGTLPDLQADITVRAVR
jgi:hypothetical protein